jgi:hypothetical protein
MDGFKNPARGLFSFCTRALAVMQERGRRATPLLIPLLDHPTKDVRERAAALLANHPDPQAYEALLGALNSKDGVVQMYAAQGLGYLKNPAATERLIGLLNEDNLAMRSAVIGALGSVYTPQLRKTLAHVARHDPAVMVRDVAAHWLLQSNDPLAARLGRRYKPIALSPARQRGIQMLYAGMLAMTFVATVAVALGSVLASRKAGSPRLAIAGLAACCLGVGGVLWGGVVPNVTMAVEYVLLLVIVPLGTAAAYGLAVLLRQETFRGAFMGFIGSFYLGYALGWLWLWGCLGF